MAMFSETYPQTSSVFEHVVAFFTKIGESFAKARAAEELVNSVGTMNTSDPKVRAAILGIMK